MRSTAQEPTATPGPAARSASRGGTARQAPLAVLLQLLAIGHRGGGIHADDDLACGAWIEDGEDAVKVGADPDIGDLWLKKGWDAHGAKR